MRLPQCRERVLFTDYVTDPVKRRLLRHARFAVYPSIFEGFGLPVVECMAAGCPVITSRSSSLIELGLDAEFYFDPLSLGDLSRAFGAMHRATMHDEPRRQLSRHVTRLAASFTWDAFVERIMGKIDEKLAPPSVRNASVVGAKRRQRQGLLTA